MWVHRALLSRGKPLVGLPSMLGGARSPARTCVNSLRCHRSGKSGETAPASRIAVQLPPNPSSLLKTALFSSLLRLSPCTSMGLEQQSAPGTGAGSDQAPKAGKQQLRGALSGRTHTAYLLLPEIFFGCERCRAPVCSRPNWGWVGSAGCPDPLPRCWPWKLRESEKASQRIKRGPNLPAVPLSCH